MPIGSGGQFPYPDFKKRYDTLLPEPVVWRWADTSGQLSDTEHPERGTLALSLPNGSAEIIRDVAVAYQVIPAGKNTTPHAHTWYHLFVVQAGTGTVTFHDTSETTDLSLGDLLLVPAWSLHHFNNPTSQSLVLLNLMNIPLLAELGNLASRQSEPGA
ncbi:cupin domain-containing protein [Streptomyces indonesiensis]